MSNKLALPASGAQVRTRWWTKARTTAAQLTAEGEMTMAQIEARIGKSHSWLAETKRDPEFIARVEDIRAAIADEVLRIGIANRVLRVQALHDRWGRLKQVVTARAADTRYADVPGYSTGLMVHTFKQVGSGPGAALVDEFAVDTGTLAAFLAVEKQAAQEAGQWSEKRELTGKDGGPIKGDFTWSDLVRLAAEDEAAE